MPRVCVPGGSRVWALVSSASTSTIRPATAEHDHEPRRPRNRTPSTCTPLVQASKGLKLKLGFRVEGWSWVQGLGFRVEGFGLRV